MVANTNDPLDPSNLDPDPNTANPTPPVPAPPGTKQKGLRLVTASPPPRDKPALGDNISAPDEAQLLESEVGLLRMDEVPQDAAESIASIERMLGDPHFVANRVSQVDAIRLLQRALRSGVDLIDLKSRLLSKIPGMPPERFEFVLKMKRRRDVRAALKYEHVEPVERYPDEQLYPTANDGWLGAYLQFNEATEVPLAYHFWNGVSVLGAAMRRNVYIHEGLGYYLYPNHYILLVGESAAGKGWAIGRARSILTEANNHCLRSLSGYVGGVKDRRVKVLPDKCGAEQMCTILAPQGFTTHPLARNSQLVDCDSIGAYLSDEVSTLLTKKGHNPDLLIRILTRFYTCDDEWVEGALYRGLNNLVDMALTFVSGSTVTWLNDGITDDLFSSGFMSRFLFVSRHYSERFFEGGSPMPDPVQRDALARSLVPWMLCTDIEVEMTEGTRKVWSEFLKWNRERIRNPEDPRMQPYYIRMRNHVAKLAMTLQASSMLGVTYEQLDTAGHIELEEATLEKALLIMRFEESYLPECFAKLGQTPDAKAFDIIMREVVAFNKTTGRAMKVKTELGKRIRTKVGADYEQKIKDMVDMGLLATRRAKPPGGRGRPHSVIWCPDTMGKDWEPGRKERPNT